jgi:hypothetical protein
MPPAARENFLKKVLSGVSQKLLMGFASIDARLVRNGRERAKPRSRPVSLNKILPVSPLAAMAVRRCKRRFGRGIGGTPAPAPASAPG